MAKEGKILVHLDSDHVSVYRSVGGAVTLLERRRPAFEESFASGILPDAVSESCHGLQKFAEVVDNKTTRLYASGIFQRLSRADATRLVNSVYVDTGLYLNIVAPELERFYLEAGRSASKSNNMMGGVLRQEFREVVVCGSFQQSLKYIEDVIARVRESGAIVLSPWTTKIKPETEGTDFVLFDYQDLLKNERDTWRLKYEHMDKFRQSDAVIVCNPGGVVGKGTLFELGFMSAISKRVIFTEAPVGISISFPCEVGLDDMNDRLT